MMLRLFPHVADQVTKSAQDEISRSRHALGRDPADPERALSRELLSPQPAPEAVADFLWSLVNLPEFQIIR